MLSSRKPDVQPTDFDGSEHTELKEALKYAYVDTEEHCLLPRFSRLARLKVKIIISYGGN